MLPVPSAYNGSYCIPDLQVDGIFLVDLNFLGEVLYACGDLIIVGKFIMDIFKK